jgi:putative phage-type endonuclease
LGGDILLTGQQKEERRKGIGGSDVQSVLGLPPYGCSLRLWFDKTGVKPDFEELNPNMERGIYLEDIAVEIYKKKTGNDVVIQSQVSHNERPYMLANVDRMIIKDGIKFEDSCGVINGTIGVLEIKCPNKESYLRMKTEGIPEAYLLQGQHYLYVTNAKWMHYAIFCADMWEMQIVPVERDDKLIQLILDSEDHFWKLVQNGPKPDRLDYGDSRCKKCNWRLTCWKEEWEEQDFNYDSKDDDYEEEDDVDFIDAFREHAENVFIAKEAETLKEESKAKLERLVGDRKKVKCEAGKACFKWEVKNYIDTTRMKTEHPDIVEKYQYESGSKVFRFYPRKEK